MSGSSVISYRNSTLLIAGDMSTTLSGPGTDLQGVNNYSFQASYTTGSPAGTFKIQLSDDIVPVGPDNNLTLNVTNWNDYTGSSITVSATGSWLWKIDAGGERWARLVWTPSGGSSGSLNVVFSGKS